MVNWEGIVFLCIQNEVGQWGWHSKRSINQVLGNKSRIAAFHLLPRWKCSFRFGVLWFRVSLVTHGCSGTVQGSSALSDVILVKSRRNARTWTHKCPLLSMPAFSLSPLLSLSQGHHLAANCKSSGLFPQWIQGSSSLLLSKLGQVFSPPWDKFSSCESGQHSRMLCALWVYGAAWAEAPAYLAVRALGWANAQAAPLSGHSCILKEQWWRKSWCVLDGGGRRFHGGWFPLFLAIPDTPWPPTECLLPSGCVVKFTSYSFFHFSLDFWERFRI